MSCRRNYLLLILAMDMAKVGGPLSVVKVCTSRLRVNIGYRQEVGPLSVVHSLLLYSLTNMCIYNARRIYIYIYCVYICVCVQSVMVHDIVNHHPSDMVVQWCYWHDEVIIRWGKTTAPGPQGPRILVFWANEAVLTSMTPIKGFSGAHSFIT